MAETMQFDLVSPERSLMSGSVTSVQIPGADGDMTAMPNHAPVITTLRPGILKVEGESGTTEYVVTGGFAELGEGLSVLAERALPKADVTTEVLTGLVDEAKAALETVKANNGAVDDAAKLVADMIAVGNEIGVSVS
ncbi:MAG: F0F1 ATP synthase subunit epsilon [Rhodobacteraceae bacterium]|nr:F0F1 ATP synthase subunit epsilon [Paracoccaceae bacterium]